MGQLIGEIAVSQIPDNFFARLVADDVKNRVTVQQRNELVKEQFLDVLRTRKPKAFMNAGFIEEGQNIKTYTQEKKGLEYFYGKRKVLADGVSTTHLDI